MKVRLPLSLKVSVWLLLNLVLLGSAAIAFLVAQGGLSWDSLVVGTPGDRMHSLANVISGEVAAAPRDARDAVLARFANVYHAEFIIVRNRGPILAGGRIELPNVVRQRVDEGPPAGRPPGGRREHERAEAEQPPPGDPGAAPEGGREGEPQRGPRGRFLVRGGEPAAWWIGFRAPFREPGMLPGPATVIVRVNSFWSVVLLLNLETWLLVGATVLVFSVLFWLPLVRSITRQIRLLTHATEQIAEGKFAVRVPADRGDELGQLGQSVNSMAERLDHLVNGQKRFLADIAHELGSPLGRLQVATEILESRADSKLQPHVADVREEVQQMSELLGELLAFTKAGLRPRDAELTPVAVDSVVRTALAREDAAEKVEARLAPNLVARADEPLLARAIQNLVRNALRYAGDAGPITLSATPAGDHVVITLEDEGPGVAPDALSRLGEPFYRPESARTRETGGVGLGLAIVRSAVSACGGQIEFTNRNPRGFRVEIRLQAASSR